MDNSKLENIIGYSFKDKSLLVDALTHTSFANEHSPRETHNQRLEFLGDAVLDLLISEHIYMKNPKMQEGDLTKLRASLVCEDTLYHVASDLSINEYLRLGIGESQRDVRVSILADSFESVLAAIFIDGGIEPAKSFIERNLDSLYKYGSNNNLRINYKTKLQEKYARSKLEIKYIIANIDGPEHECTYTVKVLVGDKISAYGEGHTKKEAEQNAAKNVLDKK